MVPIYISLYNTWVINTQKELVLVAGHINGPDFLRSWNGIYVEAALVAAERGGLKQQLLSLIQENLMLDGVQKREKGENILRSWGVKI
ncbi:MAG: hypothetical protein RL621_533 [Bacteroidota bacterium]|jgi:hypothetical protein